MRVAFLTNQYPKTSHSFVRREILAVEAAGIDVERFTVRASREPLVEPADVAERARTHVLLGRGVLALVPAVLATVLTRPRRVWRALCCALELGARSARGRLVELVYLAEACAFAREVARRGVDHVHVHFATNAVDVALLCRELGGPPFSFTAHGTSDLGESNAPSLAAKIARASFVVAVSEHGRGELLRRAAPADVGKLLVVHCGLDDDDFAAPLTATPDAARLVCVARFGPEKGHAVLLAAVAVLAREGRAFELELIGDGPLRSTLEEQVRELRLEKHVHFAGWGSGADVRTALRAARALVLASWSEGLPVVVMEAFALGRTVVATDVGGTAELVVDGENGWCVPAGDVERIAGALRDVLTLPSTELDVLGRRGAARVVAHHSASVEGRRIAQHFRDAHLVRAAH